MECKAQEDTKLIWALKNADLEEIQNLIKEEDVSRALTSGRMPIHYAADYGHVEVLDFLISKGADVNVLDKHGISPLLSAVYEGHVDCVKLLLDKGADKEAIGPDGVTPLGAAESEPMRALLK